MRFALPLLVLFLLSSCGSYEGGWPRSCPNPGNKHVFYTNQSWDDRDWCEDNSYTCADEPLSFHYGIDEDEFIDECGCGCWVDRPGNIGDF